MLSLCILCFSVLFDFILWWNVLFMLCSLISLFEWWAGYFFCVFLRPLHSVTNASLWHQSNLKSPTYCFCTELNDVKLNLTLSFRFQYLSCWFQAYYFHNNFNEWMKSRDREWKQNINIWIWILSRRVRQNKKFIAGIKSEYFFSLPISTVCQLLMEFESIRIIMRKVFCQFMTFKKMLWCNSESLAMIQFWILQWTILIVWNETSIEFLSTVECHLCFTRNVYFKMFVIVVLFDR